MLRKFLLAMGITAAISLSAQDNEDENQTDESPCWTCRIAEEEAQEQGCAPCGFWDKLGHNLTFYFPNRALDLGDMLSINTSFGMGFLYFRATNYIQFGADGGDKYFTTEVFHREYPQDFRPSYMEFSKYISKNMPFGSGHSNGSRAGFLCFAMEDETVSETSGKVKSYKYESCGIPSFDDEVYRNKIKDFWAIETSVGTTGWNMGFNLHPVEIADFIAGIFLIDLSNDDLEGTTILRVE